MKAIEQYFHVVLFITQCKVVLTFKNEDDLSKGKNNEQYFQMHVFLVLYTLECGIILIGQSCYWKVNFLHGILLGQCCCNIPSLIRTAPEIVNYEPVTFSADMW